MPYDHHIILEIENEFEEWKKLVQAQTEPWAIRRVHQNQVNPVSTISSALMTRPEKLNEKEYALEHCEGVIREDRQFDPGHCHKSCGDCCKFFGRTLTETVCEKSVSLLLMSCRIFCIMKVAKPCCDVFKPDNEVRREPVGFGEMRRDSRKAILKTQTAIFPFLFQVIWSFVMAASLLMFCGMNIRQIVLQDQWISQVVACVLNISLASMWFVFAFRNILRYKPTAEEPIKGEHNYLSYFAMEQVQQYVSELSVYPQLCTSFMQLTNIDGIAFIPFIVSCMLLMIVFALRIFTVVRIRSHISIYFRRFLFSCVANSILVVNLAAGLLSVSVDERGFPVQLSITFLISITSIWNHFIFYIAHIYEVSLQSGINSLRLGDANPRLTSSLVAKLTNREAFHKMMYPMASPGYGTLLYFWTMPSFIVLVVCFIDATHDDVYVHFFVMCGYYILLLIFNYKAFLLTSAVHFTAFIIVLLFAVLSFISMAIISLYIFIIAAIIVLLIIATKSRHNRD